MEMKFKGKQCKQKLYTEIQGQTQGEKEGERVKIRELKTDSQKWS